MEVEPSTLRLRSFYRRRCELLRYAAVFFIAPLLFKFTIYLLTIAIHCILATALGYLMLFLNCIYRNATCSKRQL